MKDATDHLGGRRKGLDRRIPTSSKEQRAGKSDFREQRLRDGEIAQMFKGAWVS